MTDWPLLTQDLPPSGGQLKATPEDFAVEELPTYEPVGQGEHLFLWVEKKGRSTPEAAQAIAKAAGLRPDAVSYAGLKDRQAVTAQYLCVPAVAAEALKAFEHPDVRITRQVRHTNKLRTGHLRGNRFRIRLREVKDFDAALTCLQRLGSQGVPNYFGDQRFGAADDNAKFGRLLLKGERLPRRPDKFHRKLYLSAFQSLLFNRALADRLTHQTWASALRGDVLKKHDSGGLFVCEAPEVDQPRVEAFEVSAAGPIFGPKMVAARDDVHARELALLAEAEVTEADFERGRGETEGTRRSYRIVLEGLEHERSGDDLLLTFALPKGSYATVVLNELMKS